MQKMILVLLIVLLPVFAQAEPEIKGTPGELSNYLSSLPKEVTLVGEAKIEIQAESGVVTLGIRTEDPQLQRSLENNQRLRKEIIAKLASAGVPQGSIKGTKFSSTPEYGIFGKKPNNYVVQNILKITIENEKQLQEVAGIVDHYKDAFFQGITLKEQKKKDIKNQLLNTALANAELRRKVYEKELGIKLEPVRFVENISVEQPFPVAQRLVKSKADYMSNASIGTVEREDLSLGEHVYYGSVQIQYRVVGK